MNGLKRMIAGTLSAVTLLGSMSALAANGWVSVSSWAYNEVSNFTTEGLIPESFADVTDYKADITREQFAELVYSVLDKSGKADLWNTQFTRYFEDCDNEAVDALVRLGILFGEKKYDEENGQTRWFYPDENLTRQDAAAIIRRALKKGTGYSYYNDEYESTSKTSYENEYTDNGDISDYAVAAVYKLRDVGIMTGDDNNFFNPKENVSIEQAIAMCYRMYRTMPVAADADGFGIDAAEETEIQSYPNGLTETKLGDMLYVKNGSDIVKQFETDVYSRILSAGDYICAENFNHRTEIYSVSDGSYIGEIEYTAEAADDEYITVRKNRIGVTTYGLCDYSGNVVLEPEYSLSEIEYLRANSFTPPTVEKSASEGWVYYSDWNDGGHLYKTDSNGENTQKLSDNDCYDIDYYDGRVYYSVRTENSDEKNLWCVEVDGSNEQCLFNDKRVYFLEYAFADDYNQLKDGDARKEYLSDYLFGGKVKIDGKLYLSESTSDEKEILWGLSFDDNGKAVKTKLAELPDTVNESGNFSIYPIYGGEPIIMANIYEFDDDGNMVKSKYYRIKNGEMIEIPGDYYGYTNIYPISDSVYGIWESDDDGDRYCTMDADGSNKTLVSEVKAIPAEYDPDINVVYPDEYLIDEFGVYHGTMEPVTGSDSDDESAENAESEELKTEVYNIETLSDESFRVSEKYVSGSGDVVISKLVIVRDANGTETEIEDSDDWDIVTRCGSKLYFKKYSGGGTDGNLYSYDMTTGETDIAADDSEYLLAEIENKCILYMTKNGNYHRLDFADGKKSEIYPNSGINPYGKIYALSGGENGNGDSYIGDNDRHIYKIDTDGNVTDIVKTYAAYWIYVENGADEPTDFSEKWSKFLYY